MSRRIISAMIGNILEWYDFALYGSLTPMLASNFFPAQNKHLAILGTFLVFAIGFFMRPLGGIMFGHFGDRHGRSKAMFYSILLISAPTFILGCLPTYYSIGMYATLILLACRLVQGLVIGGEYPGSILTIAENIKMSHLGLGIRWVIVSPFVGMLLGVTLCSVLVTCLPETVMYDWGWRVPFLLSLVLGCVGFYYRRHLAEPAEFLQMQQQNRIVRFPLKEAIKTHLGKIFVVFFLLASTAVTQYILIIYIVSYLNNINHVEINKILVLHNLGVAALIISLLIGGAIVVKLKWSHYFLFSNLSMLVLSYPIFVFFQQSDLQILVAFILLGLLIGVSVNYMPYLLVKFFPVNFRYSAAALAYNLAFAIFAGLTPFVAAWLVHVSHNNNMPAFFMAAATLLSLITYYLTRKKYVEEYA